MTFVCPTCHGRYGGPHTHTHMSRPTPDLFDPRFAGCPVCHGHGRIESCDTCDGCGRVEMNEDGSFRPAKEVADALNAQALRPWDGAPGEKLRRPR